MNSLKVHEMFGQSENCGLLSANIPKRYIKLGTTGKPVPGVKTKIIERNDEVLKTPMLDGGFAPEIGGVSFFSLVFIVRQLFSDLFQSIIYSTVNLLLFYKFPDCFYKQSSISALFILF